MIARSNEGTALNVGGALRAATRSKGDTNSLQVKPESTPHSSNLRTYRSYGRAGCWFVTKCVEPRRPALVGETAQAISAALKWYIEHDRLHVAAFVVMPDHWHLMFHASAQDDVMMFMRKACHWISRVTSETLQRLGVEWQDGYHETRIRTLRQFQFVRVYIENNPVRKNCVPTADGWEWSSAHPKYRGLVPQSWPFVFDEDE